MDSLLHVIKGITYYYIMLCSDNIVSRWPLYKILLFKKLLKIINNNIMINCWLKHVHSIMVDMSCRVPH